MKKYALIGKNIQDSLSPVIHGAYGCQYDLLDVKEDQLEWALSQPYDGFNVTSPYKEKITQFVEPYDHPVAIINTIKKVDGKLYAYNTDSVGFITALKRARVSSFDRIGILGSGAMAKLVQMHCHNSEIISSRSYGGGDFQFLEGLINATPHQRYVISGLPQSAWVMDLGYKDDTFIKNARARGNFAFNGMGMLIAQAEESQRIWSLS